MRQYTNLKNTQAKENPSLRILLRILIDYGQLLLFATQTLLLITVQAPAETKLF